MDMMFGLLQILLESLPISSSGHLQLLGLNAFVDYDRFLHGPTVLILVIYFLPEILFLFAQAKYHLKQLFGWIVLLIFANSCTVLVYALLEKYTVHIPLWFGLGVTGCLLIASVLFAKERGLKNSFDCTKNNYLPVMACIGLAQGTARLAGVSRLGTTYSAAVFCGFSPAAAFRIACALQVPLFGAGCLEGIVGLYKKGMLAELFTLPFLLTMLLGMFGAYLLLWFVESLILAKKIWLIGVYMICLSAIVFVFG